MLEIAKKAFESAGFEVAINTPFAGSIVPLEYYGKDNRASSLMIEVRRDLYMNETTGKPRGDYLATKARLNRACKQIYKYFNQIIKF